MGCRHMIYWRVYVYANNLYAISGVRSLSYRDCTPSTLRRQPNELHRLLDFANRDLSVLIRHSELELMNVFDTVQDLLLEVNLRSAKFKEALAPHLKLATAQFVHELNNFARSPFDDLISYDCNVKYRAVPLREEEKVEGSEATFMLLPGIQSFAHFSRLVDNDQWTTNGLDFDVEDEDPKMMDESVYSLGELSPSMMDELRRQVNERRARRQSSFPSTSRSAARTIAATTVVAHTATGDAADQPSASFTPSDFGLELAVERSLLDRALSDTTSPRRQQRVATGRQVVQQVARGRISAIGLPAHVAARYRGAGANADANEGASAGAGAGAVTAFGSMLRVAPRPRGASAGANKRRFPS